MNNPIATVEWAKELGLLSEEFDKICQYLNRTPNFLELSVYSVMWSEHCSYKNSIIWLKQLPKTGARVLAEAGEENAGLIDIGDNLGLAFKIESHNHPSAVEPFQGAATGVGGIHRDIFTMGARPIAALNSLRFGDLQSDKTKNLVKGVVSGISHYGNCFGVPTVGGEIYFDSCYHTNPLVNAMSVGVVPHNQTATATASGIGNPVFIVGAATGKDGIHGATFASEDITEDSAQKLPSIQIGDPFLEKLLLEATLEAIQTGCVVGIQDMGAAGITCSTSEMAAKGEVGMDVWLDKVPLRQQNMQAWEILLSESQERMLIVVEKGKEATIMEVFGKWDLSCVQIGVVTDTKNIRYYWEDTLMGEIPADSLVLGGGAPVYQREFKEPAYTKKVKAFKADKLKEPTNLQEVAQLLIQLPSIASKKWITNLYDSMVGTANLSTNYPADAAVVWIKGTQKGIGMTTDCNSNYVLANPFAGTALTVAEAARNLVCAGATPLGVTNCLNFGNPYNPEVYWQFKEAILGMKAACEKFNIPVTGGNVSFYNQSPEGPIHPTPTIGMVGLVENIEEELMTLSYQEPGDYIFVVGTITDSVGSSAYVREFHKKEYSPAPYLDLDGELALQTFILKMIRNKIIRSAHDVSDGGLAINLLESGFQKNLGFDVVYSGGIRQDFFWFGEGGGRIVVSVKPSEKNIFEFLAIENEISILNIGMVTEGEIRVNKTNWGKIQQWKTSYEHAIENYFIPR